MVSHLVENLQEGSLIALCIVNDYMLANNLTPSYIQISKAMLENVKASNRRYKNKLQERRDAQNKDIKFRERKQLLQQIDEIAKKKKEKRKACCLPLLKKVSNFLMNYPYKQRQRKTFKFFERPCKTETQGIK